MIPQFQYGVYGVSLRSDIPLALPESYARGLAQSACGLTQTIDLRTAPPETFTNAIADTEPVHRADWYQYPHLEDRSSYVRWRGLGEFIVSGDGSQILCHRFEDAHAESFQV